MAASEENNSRLNATKHGCCAKTLILPDECQEDFEKQKLERQLEAWKKKYGVESETQPEGRATKSTVRLSCIRVQNRTANEIVKWA